MITVQYFPQNHIGLEKNFYCDSELVAQIFQHFTGKEEFCYKNTLEVFFFSRHKMFSLSLD